MSDSPGMRAHQQAAQQAARDTAAASQRAIDQHRAFIQHRRAAPHVADRPRSFVGRVFAALTSLVLLAIGAWIAVQVIGAVAAFPR
ncbi:hypothetical protein [Micromonospora sp. WMMD1082]|uniref:hypothetical protein n=1 Tax=Micromonospora sp. WMMD1082 TaxID=3016104 RepID=UPI0024176B83|nr:hypothetical protein [Micromonospora sp. WMMD1082]MDG4798049.1 hypothetical protein [Micromonospora sp. WMMD1082]